MAYLHPSKDLSDVHPMSVDRDPTPEDATELMFPESDKRDPKDFD